MPRRDGTGPQWEGPMTWAKMGSCKSEGQSWKNVEFGRGKGNRGCGQGKWMWNRWKDMTNTEEKA